MTFLGFDCGSSSVKAGIVRGGRIVGKIVRASYQTHFDGARAEVDPRDVLKAIQSAVEQLGSRAKKIDAINLSVMSPAWVAMDKAGKPLTPLITHQDRRSIDVAHGIVKKIGKAKLLSIAGNLPFPGGISSTTLGWFLKNQPDVISRADLLGHLNTFLHRQITAQRVIDPSNASFTGLYETVKQGGWSETLCRGIGISESKLPEIIEGDVIAGQVTHEAARRFGLVEGTPMFPGLIDTSAAMMLTRASIGQLLNVSGSTDVLGLCTDEPHPNEKLLTRALGIGRKWMSVGTLAAAGSAITWFKDQFCCELSTAEFYRLVAKLANQPSGKRGDPKSGDANPSGQVIFEPYLAGERTSIDQKYGAFHGLTLATTRDEMLAAVIDALAKASGQRLVLLKSTGAKILRHVITSGGAARSLHAVLHRDWPGRWTFKAEEEASLRGLSMVDPREK